MRVAILRRPVVLSILATGTVAATAFAAGPGATSGRAVAAAPATAPCTSVIAHGPYRAAPSLRFGIDSQPAGDAGATQGAVAPVNRVRTLAALRALRAPDRELVLRLNRLFESEGEGGIRRFQGLVRRDDRAGFDSEIQVRYHPSASQAGNMADWTRFVRRVAGTFADDPHVVALTITNEINVPFSPNTSDGAYPRAEQALISGILAAHRELVRRGNTRMQVGFTYAYRFDPATDARVFSELRRGGPAFRRALGFVGVDYYPQLVPGATTPVPAATLAMLADVRDCLMGLGRLGPRVPIWITETGEDTGQGGSLVSFARQRTVLRQIVDTVRGASATDGVTDLRWFNLRDNVAHPTHYGQGSGLLTAGYRRKPAFAALRALIARYGAPVVRGG